MKKQTLFILISYLLIYIIWGSTYFFIKLSVGSISPLVVVSLRWSIGGLLFLLVYFAFAGLKVPDLKEAGYSVFMGILLILIPNFVLTTVEKKMDSYLAALIIATVPIIVSFFDLVLHGKKVSLITFLGMLIGVIGVGFLVYNGSSIKASFSRELLLLIFSMIVWSLGVSLGHKINSTSDVMLHAGVQMLSTGIICCILLVLFYPEQLSNVNLYSVKSLSGVLYLIVFGSIAYGAFNYLIKHEPAIRVSSYALVNPVIAVFLGLMIGSESPVKYIAIGVPFILSGLALMLYGETLFAYIKKSYFNINENND